MTQGLVESSAFHRFSAARLPSDWLSLCSRCRLCTRVSNPISIQCTAGILLLVLHYSDASLTIVLPLCATFHACLLPRHHGAAACYSWRGQLECPCHMRCLRHALCGCAPFFIRPMSIHPVLCPSGGSPERPRALFEGVRGQPTTPCCCRRMPSMDRFPLVPLPAVRYSMVVPALRLKKKPCVVE